jgi:hypothetical protein
VIVVDTNVISELMRGEPHPAVLGWVARQPRALQRRMPIRRKFSTGLARCARAGGAQRWLRRPKRCLPRILPAVSCPSRRARPRAIPRSCWRGARLGIRLRAVIGVDNMIWGSDYPHSESTFPRSRQILAEILAGVPDD